MLIFFGLLFGSFAPADGPGRGRVFAAGVIAASVFTLVAMVSYVVAPDWMWMYYARPAELRVLLLFIPIGYLFVFVLAFAAAIQVRARAARGLSLVALLWEGLVVSVTWERYHLIGTREQWIEGAAHELFSISPTGPARTVGLLSLPLVIVIAIGILVAWRTGREATARR